MGRQGSNFRVQSQSRCQPNMGTVLSATSKHRGPGPCKACLRCLCGQWSSPHWQDQAEEPTALYRSCLGLSALTVLGDFGFLPVHSVWQGSRVTESRKEMLNRGQERQLVLGRGGCTCVGGTAYAAFRTWYLLTPRGVCVQCLLTATERHKAFANSLRQGQRATNATHWKKERKIW